ncbi:MAG TPA: tol-pal system protein YbgF [Bryobacteraceae bacterium]|nr:tol-pal system protein YbgF [Bryobacteraceae bacterium]
MILTRLSLPFLLLVAVMPLAAQKTNDMIREVQRDLAVVQQDIKNLNSKFDEKMAVMTTLLQQALAEAGAASRGVAVLDRQIKDSLKEQQNLVAAPVAALGSKVDTMGQEYSALNENVKELSGRMSKVDAKINEVLAAIKTLKEAPAPPPTALPNNAGSANSPPPGVTAEQIYKQALSDKEGGNFELALTEFKDYLRFFPTAEFAPNAQFYIGEIHYYQKDYDAAIANFDMVLEKYPANNKTPDAMYLKGRALTTTDRKQQAAKVLRDVIANYPNTEAARKSRDLLKATAPAANPSRKKNRE